MKVKKLIEQTQKALKILYPEVFRELTNFYESLVRTCVDEDCSIDEQLKTMAINICQINGGASDVIDIHTNAMSSIVKDVNPFLSKRYIQEGNVRLLQLMGLLVECYRLKS